jgi:hypothetical protein
MAGVILGSAPSVVNYERIGAKPDTLNRSADYHYACRNDTDECDGRPTRQSD